MKETVTILIDLYSCILWSEAFQKDGQLDMARTLPPLQAWASQMKEKQSLLLQFKENTPLMKSNVWRVEALSIKKCSSIWHLSPSSVLATDHPN